MKIVITGCKGRIGGTVLDYARSQGAEVLGVDTVGIGNFVDYIHADMNDLAQVYDVLHGADAVVHLAAIRDPRLFTAQRTFMTNVGSTYNVLLAATHLKIQRVVLASSVQVAHVVRPRTPLDFKYFPLDEAHPLSPHDEYTQSKQVGEVLADSFAAHYGLSIVSLRYTGVTLPDAWATLPRKSPPPAARATYPHYVHVDDAARCTYLAAVADLPPSSHTCAFVTAQDTAIDIPSEEWIARYFPDAERREKFEGCEALVSGRAAREKLGFVAEKSWRAAAE